MDIHIDGHRVAFNNAFHSIGMDCVQWAPAVYNDLLGCSDGTGEGLITAYYTTVGWPVMLATSERPAFVRKVHSLKEGQLAKLLAADRVPLRPDVKQVGPAGRAGGGSVEMKRTTPRRVISDAVTSGAAVSLLCGTQCTLPEDLAASCRRLLGPDLAAALTEHVWAGDEAPTQMLSQMLSAAAGDLKQRAAMQLVCTWQSERRKEDGEGQPMGVGLDPSLMAAGGSQQRVSSEFLAALVATTGTPASSTLAVAASNAMLQAAAGSGLFPVAVPRRFATQGSFPAARAKFDGFGPGLATWPRLRALLANSNGNGGMGR
ncbi:hypothetical protein VOLCADRAFT_86777 [Volvox carteri f. nagariensis]|uniref:Uncharacterized protein n=1 Tax=Volvox carteri f. nagariensis TaxID=3068 RepID=D8TJK4_VOLCA|nr:uncharacterized protein VOLCADRAFT_86777 [Volvox carteri f. nagariensis]EFJ52558.1 hypothetical protein VOLCADRAFT_86777 [Volvox carteri f. nagariensis]|eukprot:XP_002946631.1 hypothetical protein VOLCADRAFT_86777 [Volvox carteri f. nagariensis]